MKATTTFLLTAACLLLIVGCKKKDNAATEVKEVETETAMTDSTSVVTVVEDTVPADAQLRTHVQKAFLRSAVKSVRLRSFEAEDRYGKITKGKERESSEATYMGEPGDNYLIKYDKKGREIERITFRIDQPNLEYKNFRTYDGEGRLKRVRSTMIDNETGSGDPGGWTDYLYNAKGQNHITNQYDGNGDLYVKFVNKYDEKGNLIQDTQYAAFRDGELFNLSRYKYDANNNQIENAIGGGEGEVWSVHTYQYDAAGRPIKHRWETDGNTFHDETIYTYDTDGNLTKEYIRYMDDGAEKEYEYTYKYKFDDRGNWIECIRSRYGVPKTIQTRKIDYY
ncbi:MAG: hypothetical protein LBN93_04380 [Candidatus Symbiothrix sp.]|jgi:hypothetical protein|nr:hypothetical protein [Candidatus Symbiothrix sp.]